MLIDYTIAVSGEECTVTVGSLSHNNIFVDPVDRTFILAGYIVLCSGTVVAWEFCYQKTSGTATFYPGIWRISGTGGNTNYELVQSNNVSYDQSRGDIQDPARGCQRLNLSDTDQFTAPAGSVVGLYIGVTPRSLLLHTSTSMSITTHRFDENQTSVRTTGNSDVSYNIAIRAHLGKNYKRFIFVNRFFKKIEFKKGE